MMSEDDTRVPDVAAALERARDVLTRRPAAGLHDDATGFARWAGGVRVVTRHANGREVATDMPGELGGTGREVSPGWMVRAGIAACATTTIASVAAVEGVALDALEVQVTSRSDTRGYLGLAEADGEAVYPGPHALAMHVRIAARGVSAERLKALVATAQRRAPMTAALLDAHDLALEVETA